MKEDFYDVFSIAKRLNNPKRDYLIVNRRQGKHVPILPAVFFDMTERLADKIAQNYSDVKIVVGFAETATAIGAVIAKKFDGYYYHTTREECGEEARVDFTEDHSHATEQRLYVKGFKEALDGSDAIVFVDDEITTGRTFLNMLSQLEKIFPSLKDKKIVLASILDRVEEENAERLKKSGVECVSLFKGNGENFSRKIASCAAFAPSITTCEAKAQVKTLFLPLLTPRLGVKASEYHRRCVEVAETLCGETTFDNKNICVLGTEECMYPALVAADVISRRFPSCKVRSHSTTRSPIMISEEEGYPLFNGYRINSFYEEGRINYIYDIRSYDLVILITDSHDYNVQAEKDILNVFGSYGCREFVIVRGEQNV